MTWISVEERPLGERLGPYLAYCGLDAYGLPIYLVTTWDSHNGVWRCDQDGGIIATVTHWAELSPPEVSP